jgi:flagellar basal-body rod modification protein FlgD
MAVNNVSNTSTYTSPPATTTTTGTGAVDSSQFMQLLLAQLTHQNPLEPMSNSEMMSQFSQLNSLQELRDIHTSMDVTSSANQTSYMASLIGKTIKVNQTDGTVLEGVVDGAILEKGNLQLRIGDKTVALSDVLEIDGTKASQMRSAVSLDR